MKLPIEIINLIYSFIGIHPISNLINNNIIKYYKLDYNPYFPFKNNKINYYFYKYSFKPLKN